MNNNHQKGSEAKPWVLVADHARARLFSAATPTAPLEEFEDLTNPSARLHEHDLSSDSPGRHVGGGNRQGHSADHGTKRQHTSEVFADAVGERLGQLCSAGAIARLHIVAEPGFLGLLRPRLPEAVRRLVVGEIVKVATHESVRDLRAELPVSL
jgi:protein required for attachment to host cells